MGKQNKRKARPKLKRVDPFNARARSYDNKEDEPINFEKIDKKHSELPVKLRNILQAQDMMKRYEAERRKAQKKGGFIVEKDLKQRVLKSIENDKQQEQKRKRANTEEKTNSKKLKTEDTSSTPQQMVPKPVEEPEQTHEHFKIRDFTDYTDVVKFGEVADRPPTFQKLPKVKGIPKVAPVDPSQKIPNIHQLRLTKKLQQPQASNPQEEEEKDEIQKIREEVLKNYKELKKKRVQELIQEQKSKQIKSGKSKKKEG